MSTQIKYNGEVLTTFSKGTITLDTDGHKLLGDIEIMSTGEAELRLQEKTTTENGEVVADEGYDGLSKVIVDVPVTGTIPEWDGRLSYLITFTIDDTEYTAVEGMTWGEWVESDYNIIGAYVNDIIIRVPLEGGIHLGVTDTNDEFVAPTYKIIANPAYGLEAAGGDSND